MNNTAATEDLAMGMLKITVKLKDSQSVDTISFDQFPVTIGRASSCDLTLVDETKHVSSNHAELAYTNSMVTLTDQSTNGTYINGSQSSIGKGNNTTLSDGDVLYMGDYELQLQISAQAQSESKPAENDNSLSDHEDPFDFAPDTEKTPQPQAASAPPTPIKKAVDTDDPFGWVTDSQNPRINSDDRIHQLKAEGIGPDDWKDSTDSLIDNQTGLDILKNEKPKSTVGSKPKETDDDDWAWTGAIPTPEKEKPKPANQKKSAPGSATPSRSPLLSEPDKILEALLKGAGLDPSDFSSVDSVELAHHIGSVLNRSTQSMMLLLRSRDEIKSAMRTDVTLLASANNSPLKFSVSVEDALTKLLTPSPHSGFTESKSAIEKGLQDIKVHQLAMLEAMRSALHIALAHFDPKELEKISRESSPLASTLPLAREAKLWEQFELHYHKLKRDTVDDFSDRFGKELRKAYEKSVSELKQSH